MRKILVLAILIFTMAVFSACAPVSASLYDYSLYSLTDIAILLDNEDYLNMLIERYPSFSEETTVMLENLDFSNPKTVYEIAGYKETLSENMLNELGIEFSEEEKLISLKEDFTGLSYLFYDIGTLDSQYGGFSQITESATARNSVYYEYLDEDLIYIFVYDNNIIGITTIYETGQDIVTITGHVTVNQPLTDAKDFEEAETLIRECFTKFIGDSYTYDDVTIRDITQ